MKQLVKCNIKIYTIIEDSMPNSFKAAYLKAS
jgi:hypothetical protein